MLRAAATTIANSAPSPPSLHTRNMRSTDKCNSCAEQDWVRHDYLRLTGVLEGPFLWKLGRVESFWRVCQGKLL
jgi:hypothetical protein